MSGRNAKQWPPPTRLHDRIRTDIEKRILSGDWPPGHKVPFEHELIDQYRCSRMTVNKALSALSGKGLIERRRRVGSFVARPRVHSAILTIPDLKAEVTARGDVYSYRLLFIACRRATAEDRERLSVARSARVTALRCLHLANELPFALEERLLNLASVPEARKIDFSETAPGTWLLEHVPWTDAEHLIAAAGADTTEARHLSLPRGSACLIVERRTWQQGVPITWVRQLFPGSRHQLVAHFTPAGPGT